MSDFFLFEDRPCDAFAFEDAVEQFDPNVLPIVGPAGPQGPQGPAGPAGGVVSVDGKTGVVTVLPAGGTQGQVLKKASGSDYDVEWGSGGGGGASDYDDLTDKPQINGNELSGNKSSSDLGLYGTGNAPPYPVTSVNGQTGAVTVSVGLWFTGQTVLATTGNICTISNAAITADYVLVSCEFAAPGNVTTDVTWTTSSGSLVLNGTCTAATTVSVLLMRKDN